MLNAYPKIQVNLHYTGFLLDWMEEHHPDFVQLLRKMVERNQVELVGGAYYEPVISAIPDADVIGQTALLSRKITAMFGTEPHGFWTAERAWEPQLPEVLAEVGARHTFVDDISFESVGLSEAGCFESYLVESRGRFVTVFPILKKLRYFIPFRPVSSTISYLKTAGGRGLAVYGDDGEKFGAWPSTYERVYKERWLDSFFEEITRRSWIETVKISDYLKQNPSRGRVYLPASTYSEMMEWAIPIFTPPGVKKDRRSLERGKEAIPHRGFWRLFLAKYPESARMYAKMLNLSELIHSLQVTEEGGPLLDLWKGQCNDAYWHGIFGGLYAPILRRITYENLIRAQVGYEGKIFGYEKNWLSVDIVHNTGAPEFHLNSENLGIVISPSLGGAICELDFKPRYLNMLDTLTRRPERYHSEIKKGSRRTIVPETKKRKAVSIHEPLGAKESGLEGLLIYDRYQKFTFVDYLVPIDTEIESFMTQDFRELARLPTCVYEAEIQKSNQTAALILTSKSGCENGGEIHIKKEIDLPADGLSFRVVYDFRFTTDQPSSALFLPEINLGSLSDRGFARDFSKSKVARKDFLEVPYKELGVNALITCPGASSVWIIPVKTVSLSEKGFESNLQGISILPKYLVKLNSGNSSFQTSIEVRVQSN